MSLKLIKSMITSRTWVEFDNEVYDAEKLASETNTLDERDIVAMAKGGESGIRLLSHNEVAGRLHKKFNG